MVIGLIKNETEYQQALDRIEELLAEPSNEETERELELLGHLVDKYEREQFPIEYPDPVKAIKNRMEDPEILPKEEPEIDWHKFHVQEIVHRG